MLIRIRLGRGVHIERRKGKNRHLALASAGLLIPAALMAGSLGLWSLAADMGLASGFPIHSGIFSRWLVWIGLSAVLVWLAVRLNRYGHAKPDMQTGSPHSGKRARVAS